MYVSPAHFNFLLSDLPYDPTPDRLSSWFPCPPTVQRLISSTPPFISVPISWVWPVCQSVGYLPVGFSWGYCPSNAPNLAIRNCPEEPQGYPEVHFIPLPDVFITWCEEGTRETSQCPKSKYSPYLWGTQYQEEQSLLSMNELAKMNERSWGGGI